MHTQKEKWRDKETERDRGRFLIPAELPGG
jgi:hypothetical protein